MATMAPTRTVTAESGTTYKLIQNRTLDSKSTISSSPNPNPAELRGQELCEKPTQNSVITKSRMQAIKTTNIPENQKLATQSATKKMLEQKTEKSETSLDVMNIPNTTELVWRNILLFGYLHAAAVVGLYFLVTRQVMWQTVIWGEFLTWLVFIVVNIHKSLVKNLFP